MEQEIQEAASCNPMDVCTENFKILTHRHAATKIKIYSKNSHRETIHHGHYLLLLRTENSVGTDGPLIFFRHLIKR